MKKIGSFILIILFILTLGSCNKSSLTKIKLSEVTHSVFYAPQYVALSLGYFEDEGLEIDLINAGGADKVMATLLSGEVQIGLSGPEATIYVYNNGQENYMINFAQLTKRDGSFIVGRKLEDFTLQSLKGKSILGGRKGGVPEMTLEYVIKEAGLTVAQNSDEADVNVRVDIQFNAMAGAFISGEGDYTTLFEPTATLLENQGNGYVLASVGEFSKEVPYTSYYVTKEYLKENYDVVEKFTKALYKAQIFVKENSDTVVAEALLPYFTDTSIEDLTKVVARYRQADVWCETPYFAEAGLERLMDIMEEAKELDKRAPFDKIVDNSIALKLVE